MEEKKKHTEDQSRWEEVAVSHHVPHDDWPENMHINNKTLSNQFNA